MTRRAFPAPANSGAPALGAVAAYDSGTTEKVRWFSPQEHVARALGYFIVTDSRYAGGADPTGVGDSTAAVNAAIAACAAARSGIVWFPPGQFKCNSQIVMASGVRLEGCGATTGGSNFATWISTSLTGSGSFINAHGLTGVRISGILTTNFSASFTGVMVDFTATALSELHQVYIGAQANSDTVLLALDQSTYHESHKVSFVNGGVQVLGKANNSSFCNTALFEGCHWINAKTASIKNAGQAWRVRGGAIEYGYGGIANAYRHDAGVRGESLSFDGVWTGDITATGPNTQIIWSGDNLSIENSFLGMNDGTVLQIDENGCTGIIVKNNQIDSFHNNNPTYAVDFGTTTGNSGFEYVANKIYTPLTAEIIGNIPADSLIDLGGAGRSIGLTGPQDPPNLLADDDATFEAGSGSWATFDVSKSSFARVTPGIGTDAAAGLNTTTVAGPQDVRWQTGHTGTGSMVPVTAGWTYTVAQRVMALDNTRNGDLIVQWYNSGGTNLSASVSSAGGGIPGALVSFTKGQAVLVYGTFTAPANAAFAQVQVRALATVLNDRFRFGRTMVRVGTSTNWHRNGASLAIRGRAVSQVGSNTNAPVVLNSKGASAVGLNTDPGTGTGGVQVGDGNGNVAATIGADGSITTAFVKIRADGTVESLVNSAGLVLRDSAGGRWLVTATTTGTLDVSVAP